MKRPLPLLILFVVSLLSFSAQKLAAQNITRVDGLPMTTPICLNTDYLLQVTPGSFTCSGTESFVWEKNSGDGTVTFTAVPGFPNRILARFSVANGVTIRAKHICNGSIMVVYFAGGFTTGAPSPTVSPSTIVRCGSGTVSLSATPPSGHSIRWYNSSGTVVSSSNNYSPSVSSSTTYYAVAYSNTGGCTKESSRIPVTVTINPLPGLPTAPSVGRCGPGAVTLTATPGSNGTTCNWYTSTESTGSITLLQSNSTTFTTPSLSASTLYNVTTVNTTTGCESTYRKVGAEITVVAAPTSPSNIQRCGPGSVSFSATPASGAVIRWYPDAISTFVIWTGSTYTTTLSTTTTIYAANYYSSSGCVSTRIPVTVTINPIPAAPADVEYEGSPCSAGTIVTVVPGTNGTTCRWYTASSGGSPFFTGTSYTLPGVATYYVSSYNATTGCESTSRAAVGCSGGRKATSQFARNEQGSTTSDLWSVYPNPSANGEFKIEISDEQLSQEAVLQVLDREGREHIRHEFVERKKDFTASLPAGLYLVRLSGKTFREVKKLIIL